MFVSFRMDKCQHDLDNNFPLSLRIYNCPIGNLETHFLKYPFSEVYVYFQVYKELFMLK